MRHRSKRIKFGRQGAHRKATMESLVSSLIRYQRIETTVTKAKAAGRFADKLMTLAKKGSVHHRRMAYSALKDRDLISILFNELAPLFSNRQGGYTRVIRTSVRTGDGAQLAILEWTETRPVVKEVRKKTKKEEPAKKEKPRAEAKPEVVKEEVKKEAEKPKIAKKPEEPPKEEKKKTQEKPPEQAKKPLKEEQGEKKGFLGGLRKLFGKKKKD